MQPDAVSLASQRCSSMQCGQRGKARQPAFDDSNACPAWRRSRRSMTATAR
ncbi:hypothetical protein WN944_012758 [Citrus x changshan-huyou]|uniref:Uncharacterized protein n=1 Tax=Citrus x changshan-huyou TaxID=2935761 RepID=A0AAP0M7C0_9ROSI